jgi:hypothetical protein
MLLRGRAQQAHTPISGVHSPLNPARGFEPVDHLPHAHDVDAQGRRQPPLVDPWSVIHRGQHPILSRRQARWFDHLGRHAHADLMKASREVRRHAMPFGYCKRTVV